jgi:hypothetical protein
MYLSCTLYVYAHTISTPCLLLVVFISPHLSWDWQKSRPSLRTGRWCLGNRAQFDATKAITYQYLLISSKFQHLLGFLACARMQLNLIYVLLKHVCATALDAKQYLPNIMCFYFAIFFVQNFITRKLYLIIYRLLWPCFLCPDRIAKQHIPLEIWLWITLVLGMRLVHYSVTTTRHHDRSNLESFSLAHVSRPSLGIRFLTPAQFMDNNGMTLMMTVKLTLCRCEPVPCPCLQVPNNSFSSKPVTIPLFTEQFFQSIPFWAHVRAPHFHFYVRTNILQL